MAARSAMRNDTDVAVIGAGPYGLAVASHLKARGVATHSFGEPMSFWRGNMPKGMKLRSPWGATDISHPTNGFSLDAYVKSHGAGRVEPYPLEDFVGYGAWFQAHAVPELDRRMVSRIEATGGGFRIVVAEGEPVFAKRVVMATGLANQEVRPAAFANAPADLATHSCEHDNLERFRGKRVAVVGRGQSACETAVLLAEAGAESELICRGPIHWLGASRQEVAWRRALAARLAPLMASPSSVGPFPLNWLVELPDLVRLFPRDLRDAFNAASLRAGAAGWLQPRFGGVRVRAGGEIVSAAAKGGRIELKFENGADAFDHVVLATGYKIDIARIGILAPELLSAIERREGSPVLSAGFESSAPGLYFVGASAVSSLGPLMRFIAGTGFAATRATRAIAAQNGRARAGKGKRLGYDLAK